MRAFQKGRKFGVSACREIGLSNYNVAAAIVAGGKLANCLKRETYKVSRHEAGSLSCQGSELRQASYVCYTPGSSARRNPSRGRSLGSHQRLDWCLERILALVPEIASNLRHLISPVATRRTFRLAANSTLRVPSIFCRWLVIVRYLQPDTIHRVLLCFRRKIDFLRPRPGPKRTSNQDLTKLVLYHQRTPSKDQITGLLLFHRKRAWNSHYYSRYHWVRYHSWHLNQQQAGSRNRRLQGFVQSWPED